MKEILLVLLVLFSVTLKAEVKNVSLMGSIQFFRQAISNEISLPISLGQKQNLNVVFNLDTVDGFSLKKVFSSSLFLESSSTDTETLRANIEVYYFNRPEGEYFSQQVFVYRNDRLIAKCTSYFSLEQNYLVPGVCSGRDGESLFGTALYKFYCNSVQQNTFGKRTGKKRWEPMRILNYLF